MQTFVKQQFGRGDSVGGATSGSTSARGDSLEGEDATAAAATATETGDSENAVRISPKSPLSPKSPESVSSTCTSEDANRCDLG